MTTSQSDPSPGAVGETLSEGSPEAAESVRARLRDWKDDAAGLAEAATARVRDAAATGRDRTADGVHALAEAARERAARMDADGRLAGYARKTADGLDRVSESLKDFDVGDLAADARAFVRDHPAIATGLAVVGGFALAQMIRAVVSDGDA